MSDVFHFAPHHPLAQMAWLDCLRWAIGEPEIRKRAALETGIGWSPPRTVIESMIDDSTGYADAFASSFVWWFNGAIWGETVDPETGECSPMDYADRISEDSA